MCDNFRLSTYFTGLAGGLWVGVTQRHWNRALWLAQEPGFVRIFRYLKSMLLK